MARSPAAGPLPTTARGVRACLDAWPLGRHRGPGGAARLVRPRCRDVASHRVHRGPTRSAVVDHGGLRPRIRAPPLRDRRVPGPPVGTDLAPPGRTDRRARMRRVWVAGVVLRADGGIRRSQPVAGDDGREASPMPCPRRDEPGGVGLSRLSHRTADRRRGRSAPPRREGRARRPVDARHGSARSTAEAGRAAGGRGHRHGSRRGPHRPQDRSLRRRRPGRPAPADRQRQGPNRSVRRLSPARNRWGGGAAGRHRDRRGHGERERGLLPLGHAPQRPRRSRPRVLDLRPVRFVEPRHRHRRERGVSRFLGVVQRAPTGGGTKRGSRSAPTATAKVPRTGSCAASRRAAAWKRTSRTSSDRNNGWTCSRSCEIS